MRMLWVKVGGLWPLNTGGRLRTFHTLSQLSRRHPIDLLTTHGPGDDPEALAAHLPHCRRVVSVPHHLPKQGSARFAVSLTRSWLSTLPVDLWKCQVQALRTEITRQFGADRPDLCVADFLAAAPNVPFGGPVPVVLFEHNVEHIIWKRLSQSETRWWRRGLLEVEWRKMRCYERRACLAANLTVAVSEADRALLAATAPAATVRAIPTGVDSAFFVPNGSPERADSLVFTASLDWFPNDDGVLHFMRDILPRIRQEIPCATVTVVGRNPRHSLRVAAAAAGVKVTGTVDDIRPYVADAAVYVVPLRIGGGTRVKIFEALAMGKAVVSTTVGAEGLPLVPGQHFLQADDPAEFARAVVSLMRDPARRKALGQAGRGLIEERYTWAHVAREFERQCAEVMESHAG